MKTGIATDSTSDLPTFLIEQHDIVVVPSMLVLDGVEYADGAGISREEFYRRLPHLETHPTTAAAAPGQFAMAYESLFARGYDKIISIHAPAALTTIINTARQAAQPYADKIVFIDSGSLSLGLGFQVLAAAEAAELGMEAALEAIASTRRRLRVNAALDTLEYLKRSGRVPAAVSALGGALSIKPLIELQESLVKPIGAVRTRRQADERLLNNLLTDGPFERLAILHTVAEQRARDLLDALMEKASQSIPRDILLVNVTPVIGNHLGPNGLGFASVRLE